MNPKTKDQATVIAGGRKRAASQSKTCQSSARTSTRYELQVKAGEFLVPLQGDDAQIERARSRVTAGKPETTEVVQAAAA